MGSYRAYCANNCVLFLLLDIVVFVLFSIPAIIMATDYCETNEQKGFVTQNPYPCDQVAQMVLSMRSLATALIFFCDRGRRAELLDFRVLCRKVWRRLKADARLCAGTATGGRAVVRGTGDGYRLQFNQNLDDVHEFSTVDSFTSSIRSAGSGPLHSVHGDHDHDEDAGIAYQLMDDDGGATGST